MNCQVVLQSGYSGTILSPLLELHDCPEKINYRGTLPTPDHKVLTVVGSRKCSAYAKQALEHLIRNLTGYPIVIVSGMALGIDALSHKTALENNLPTIAVPGSGIDDQVLYPATNQNLAKQILQSGGCLLSEMENNTRAARWTFPKRNRIMARMADLVLVVEAGEKSGTLITSRQASEFGVDVAVIPNTIFAETARGSNALINQGAHVVNSAQDVLNLLGIDAQTHQPKTYTDVSETEIIILDVLSEPLTRDELLSVTGIEPSDLGQNLTLLEIKGHVAERAGKIYKI